MDLGYGNSFNLSENEPSLQMTDFEDRNPKCLISLLFQTFTQEKTLTQSVYICIIEVDTK